MILSKCCRRAHKMVPSDFRIHRWKGLWDDRKPLQIQCCWVNIYLTPHHLPYILKTEVDVGKMTRENLQATLDGQSV